MEQLGVRRKKRKRRRTHRASECSVAFLTLLCADYVSSQCARRGLLCLRPTESKRGVRRGKCRETDGEEEDTQTPGASSSQVTLELAPRPRVGQPPSHAAEDTVDEEDDIEYVFEGNDGGEDDQAGPSGNY